MGPNNFRPPKKKKRELKVRPQNIANVTAKCFTAKKQHRYIYHLCLECEIYIRNNFIIDQILPILKGYTGNFVLSYSLFHVLC